MGRGGWVSYPQLRQEKVERTFSSFSTTAKQEKRRERGGGGWGNIKREGGRSRKPQKRSNIHRLAYGRQYSKHVHHNVVTSKFYFHKKWLNPTHSPSLLPGEGGESLSVRKNCSFLLLLLLFLYLSVSGIPWGEEGKKKMWGEKKSPISVNVPSFPAKRRRGN